MNCAVLGGGRAEGEVAKNYIWDMCKYIIEQCYSAGPNMCVFENAYGEFWLRCLLQ